MTHGMEMVGIGMVLKKDISVNGYKNDVVDSGKQLPSLEDMAQHKYCTFRSNFGAVGSSVDP